ncbi:MAG: hypothetical protein KDA80_03625 [Planctomycetaceae bacterium]|nr:hypothetical protein [Planctomycetaceae bacterium]
MRHRKTVKHDHQPGDFHQFTFSTYRRKPLLTNDCWRGKLARRVARPNLAGSCSDKKLHHRRPLSIETFPKNSR